jgi:hypothetical protein
MVVRFGCDVEKVPFMLDITSSIELSRGKQKLMTQRVCAEGHVIIMMGTYLTY